MNLAVAHQVVTVHREQIWEKDRVSVLCVTQVAQRNGLITGKIAAKIDQFALAIHALQDRRTLILMGLQDRKGAVPQKNIDRAVVVLVRKQRQEIMLSIDP
jgi:LmbE family N-acetylglucosaminyl deacetylase